MILVFPAEGEEGKAKAIYKEDHTYSNILLARALFNHKITGGPTSED